MRSKVRRSLPPEGLLSKEANAQQMENLAMLACWVPVFMKKWSKWNCLDMTRMSFIQSAFKIEIKCSSLAVQSQQALVLVPPLPVRHSDSLPDPLVRAPPS